mgnify:CR=1 FL=1
MSLINNVIRKIFGGTKSEKDIREIQPLVERINEIEKQLVTINAKINIFTQQ